MLPEQQTTVTGRLDAATLVFAALCCLPLVVVSRLLWKPGLRRYSGASA